MLTPRQAMDTMKDAISGTDLELMMSVYDEEPVLTTPDGVLRGRDALEEYWRNDFTTYTATTLDYVFRGVDGETAIDEWTMQSTEVATGTRSPLRGIDVCRLRDGLVIDHRIYYDA